MAPGTHWKPILSDPIMDTNPQDIKHICFVSGKIYYDLISERESLSRTNIAFIRVEELNPFPAKEIKEMISKYQHCSFTWLQEEPQNMGAYTYIHPRLEQVIGKVGYHGRKAHAAPATGIGSVYKKEQNYIVKGIFERFQ